MALNTIEKCLDIYRDVEKEVIFIFFSLFFEYKKIEKKKTEKSNGGRERDPQIFSPRPPLLFTLSLSLSCSRSLSPSFSFNEIWQISIELAHETTILICFLVPITTKIVSEYKPINKAVLKEQTDGKTRLLRLPLMGIGDCRSLIRWLPTGSAVSNLNRIGNDQAFPAV